MRLREGNPDQEPRIRMSKEKAGRKGDAAGRKASSPQDAIRSLRRSDTRILTSVAPSGPSRLVHDGAGRAALSYTDASSAASTSFACASWTRTAACPVPPSVVRAATMLSKSSAPVMSASNNSHSAFKSAS